MSEPLAPPNSALPMYRDADAPDTYLALMRDAAWRIFRRRLAMPETVQKMAAGDADTTELVVNALLMIHSAEGDAAAALMELLQQMAAHVAVDLFITKNPGFLEQLGFRELP